MSHDLSVGLSMIVKNESKNIRQCLESIIDEVDAVYITDTGSTDDTCSIIEQVCNDHKVPLKLTKVTPDTHPHIWLKKASEEDYKELFPYIDSRLNTLEKYNEWLSVHGGIFDFSAARQFNLKTIETNWAIWIDADDYIDAKVSVRKMVEKAESQFGVGINLLYNYKINSEKKKVETYHYKLRIFKPSEYRWTPKAPIHENLFLLKEGGRELVADQIVINHTKTDWDSSLARNIKVLRFLEEREGDHPDPRTQFLLARELFGSDPRSEEAKDHGLKYLSIHSYGIEAMQACTFIGEYYASKGDFKKQLEIAYKGVLAYPDNPEGYLGIARAYSNLGEYERVISFVKQGLTKEMNANTGAVQQEYDITVQAASLLAEAYHETKQYDLARGVLEKLLPYANPTHEQEARDKLLVVKTSKNKFDYWESLESIFTLLIDTKRFKLAGDLFKALPPLLQVQDKASQLKRILGIRKIWSKRSIVILTGGLEPWDQESVFTKGAGGSETAVVEMAMRWGKMGYEVTVYGTVEKSISYGNVTYIPFDELNLGDEFNIFVSWRNPQIYQDFDIKAVKKYLWLHDVPDAKQVQQVCQKINKVIVLSKFHRSLIPSVPDEQIYITNNGVNVEMIEEVEKEKIERNPKKIIYCSSPDRGLERALDIFEMAKKEIPDLQMTFAYGWNNFDRIRTDATSLEWKKKLVNKMKQLGVVDKGRLNKKDLLREMFSSHIWLYPSAFEEINCIVSQENQCCGVYPLTTGYAAVAENQLGGFKCDTNEEFVDRIKKITKFPTDNKMITLARERFGWQRTATEWANDLFSGVEIEPFEPLVSVVCVTIRPGIFRVLRETVEKQTYKNIELVVIDGKYEERKKEVAEYMKDFKFPFLHLPDPERDRNKYKFGLHHADNAALFAAKGELMVFVQDFIDMPEDGVQKFVDIYEMYPNDLYTGVDTRNAYHGEEVDIKDKIDVFKGKPYEIKEVQFTSPRITAGGTRASNDPFEWELNYCAAPRKLLLELGGWDNTWDNCFGYDNTLVGVKALYMGHLIWVLETNVATCLSHWDMSPGDKFGVPLRDKYPNDNRYLAYLNYLNQEPRVIGGEIDVKYPKEILNIIKKHHEN